MEYRYFKLLEFDIMQDAFLSNVEQFKIMLDTNKEEIDKLQKICMIVLTRGQVDLFDTPPFWVMEKIRKYFDNNKAAQVVGVVYY